MDLLISLFVIIALLIPFSTLGLLVVFSIMRKQQKPADQSNRINKVRLIWFALTRENEFTDLYPWLKNDERENMK